MAYQLVRAVSYLQSTLVVHWDLHGGNVLVSETPVPGGTGLYHRVVLTDFDHSLPQALRVAGPTNRLVVFHGDNRAEPSLDINNAVMDALASYAANGVREIFGAATLSTNTQREALVQLSAGGYDAGMRLCLLATLDWDVSGTQPSAVARAALDVLLGLEGRPVPWRPDPDAEGARVRVARAALVVFDELSSTTPNSSGLGTGNTGDSFPADRIRQRVLLATASTGRPAHSGPPTVQNGGSGARWRRHRCSPGQKRPVLHSHVSRLACCRS
jgi:hypothetical protein